MTAMDHPASITAHLDQDTVALVERLSAARGISSDAFAVDVIRRAAEQAAEFDAFVQVGIDAADRGDFVPHEEVMRELDDMIARQQARCQDGSGRARPETIFAQSTTGSRRGRRRRSALAS
jgi:predicted transcriptional regulator